MKNSIAVIVLALVASACVGQTVKPSLPSQPGCCANCKLPNVPRCKPKKVVKPAMPSPQEPKFVDWTLTDNITRMEPRPCGYFTADRETYLTPDKDGLCRLYLSFRVGPENSDCRFVSSEDGKTLGVSCTWKPEAPDDLQKR